jgi:phosphonate transport system permease protein
MFPPDLEYATSDLVVSLLIQTVEMSVVGAVIGFILVVPLAWFAAYNVTPGSKLLYLGSRAAIVLARSIPSIMWGMILVTMFGFGPLAGVIALTIGSIGFAGKLMAEQVEAIDMQPVEALRATGSNSLGVFLFAVIPQVSPAWAGIFVYNWDARLRSSTILGFVGAGGVGLALREQISTLNYHGALGIILAIMLLVICSEIISVAVRKRFS